MKAVFTNKDRLVWMGQLTKSNAGMVYEQNVNAFQQERKETELIFERQSSKRGSLLENLKRSTGLLRV